MITTILPEHSGRSFGSPDLDRVADLHDAAARWTAPDAASAIAAASASNVVLFRRGAHGAPHPTGRGAPPPAAEIKAARSSVPLVASRHALRFATLLALSFAAHAAWFYSPFHDDPTPMASIGEVSVSVDLVLGGKQDAGQTADRGDAEATSAAASAQDPDPAPEQPTELAKAEPVKEVRPEPPTPVSPTELAPTVPETVVAEIVPPELVHEEKRRDVAIGERTEAPVAIAPALAAGGAGRGRSDADSNYLGQVSAHLTRHQRFPAEARRRGAYGTATVAFAIDPQGRVTTVALQKSSGVPSLDQEATAMVQRASPFPPPGGGGRTFTVPVHFKFQPTANSPSR